MSLCLCRILCLCQYAFCLFPCLLWICRFGWGADGSCWWAVAGGWCLASLRVRVRVNVRVSLCFFLLCGFVSCRVSRVVARFFFVACHLSLVVDCLSLCCVLLSVLLRVVAVVEPGFCWLLECLRVPCPSPLCCLTCWLLACGVLVASCSLLFASCLEREVERREARDRDAIKERRENEDQERRRPTTLR